MIDIHSVADLRGQNHESLYENECKMKGCKEDPYQLYVCRCAVYCAETENLDIPKCKWWIGRIDVIRTTVE